MNKYESKNGRVVVVNRKEDVINIFDKPEKEGGKITEFKKVGTRVIVPVPNKVILPGANPQTVKGPLPISIPEMKAPATPTSSTVNK